MVDGRDLSLSLFARRGIEKLTVSPHSNALLEGMTHKKRHVLKLILLVKNRYLRCFYNNCCKKEAVDLICKNIYVI